MTKYNTIPVLLALTIAGAATGLNNYGTAGRGSCRISVVRSSVGDAYELRYDSAGRLHAILQRQSGFEKNFIYTGKTIIAEELVNGAPDKKITCTLNDSGMPVRIKEENYYANTVTEEVYTYQNTQLIKRSQTMYPAGRPREGATTCETYTWRNGNPVKIASYDARKRPDGVMILQYYEHKPAAAGGYWSQADLLKGIATLRPRNLLKSIRGEITTHIIYTFDAKGKITSMQEQEEDDAAPRVTQYQYQCNQ